MVVERPTLLNVPPLRGCCLSWKRILRCGTETRSSTNCTSAFYDSVGDGMGDFPGPHQKLDYLQDLGVTAIWLLPFYPVAAERRRLRYRRLHEHPSAATVTLQDFQGFLDAAHDRGLRVITELVLNHTSDQHPWFQRARRARRQPRARLLRLE